MIWIASKLNDYLNYQQILLLYMQFDKFVNVVKRIFTTWFILFAKRGIKLTQACCLINLSVLSVELIAIDTAVLQHLSSQQLYLALYQKRIIVLSYAFSPTSRAETKKLLREIIFSLRVSKVLRGGGNYY